LPLACSALMPFSQRRRSGRPEGAKIGPEPGEGAAFPPGFCFAEAEVQVDQGGLGRQLARASKCFKAEGKSFGPGGFNAPLNRVLGLGPRFFGPAAVAATVQTRPRARSQAFMAFTRLVRDGLQGTRRSLKASSAKAEPEQKWGNRAAQQMILPLFESEAVPPTQAAASAQLSKRAVTPTESPLWGALCRGSCIVLDWVRAFFFGAFCRWGVLRRRPGPRSGAVTT